MDKRIFIKVEESLVDKNCYSLTEFAKYLTKKYTKFSELPFTPYEAREFATRGRLPKKYGGQKLEYVEVEKTGVKFVRLIQE